MNKLYSIPFQKRVNIIIVFILLFSTDALYVFSQNAQTGTSYLQTVEFINKQLGKDYLVELTDDNDRLLISFYKNGTLFKTDRVYLATLDTSKVFFSAEEKALILKCRNANELTGKLKKFSDGCFEREIIEKKTVVSYGRISFDVGTEKNKINGLQKAFIQLIKLAYEKKNILD